MFRYKRDTVQTRPREVGSRVRGGVGWSRGAGKVGKKWRQLYLINNEKYTSIKYLVINVMKEKKMKTNYNVT